MKIIRLLPFAALALLVACESEAPDTASASNGTHGGSSNIHSRSSGGTVSDATAPPPGPRQIADEDVDQTLLDAAEKMIKQGDFVSATVLYKRAVNTNPKSVSALKGLAKVYEAQDRPREALESWRAIAALDETNAEAQRGMGRDLMAMGLYPKAIESLKKAHEIGGEDDLKTVNLLAMAQLRNEQKNEAIATLEEAVKSTDDLATRNNLGFAYVMSNRTDKAIPILEAVVKDPKATAQQRQNLALAYGLAGRDNDARAISLQDLPPAAVANNIKAYHAMRDKMSGKATPVVEETKPKLKKKKTAKKEAPVASPVPAAPPTSTGTSSPAGIIAPADSAPAAAPGPQTAPATPPPASFTPTP